MAELAAAGVAPDAMAALGLLALEADEGRKVGASAVRPLQTTRAYPARAAAASRALLAACAPGALRSLRAHRPRAVAGGPGLRVEGGVVLRAQGPAAVLRLRGAADVLGGEAAGPAALQPEARGRPHL
eukprot:CAMPEP_0204591802 /NCGR_PEP_ID=MMETSP0661-20131031/50573_1 /ASSEMBLY_ACC=CAM_ASM_000606 /TAXON_ID=109239 /ORGANISM="Alexandrium margalefi, Strain AMGDE01CS-322" /LENGTH=127 /DNA_ID=CAMNT_0051601959 /DNA_START=163 /DNA_END=543 /DNA_ORIENTATION=-